MVLLQPSTRYSWTVMVWNQRGEQMSETSWFETGLMSCDSHLSRLEGCQMDWRQ